VSDLRHSGHSGWEKNESVQNQQPQSDYGKGAGGGGTFPDAMDPDLTSEGVEGTGTVEPPLILLKRKGNNGTSGGGGLEQGKQRGEGGWHRILNSSDGGNEVRTHTGSALAEGI
jgi:hypothetical protein